MKRTLTTIATGSLPLKIKALVDGAAVYDSSSSPEARVYFIDKDGGYYLKIGEAGSLAREATMTEYFHSVGLGVKIIEYVTVGADYMLTERAAGEDLTHARYLADPKRLAVTMGELLRDLHSRPISGCPVMRTPEYLDTVRRNYKNGLFDLSLFGDKQPFSNADEAYAFFDEHKSLLREDVLIHGDFCLPNIMLDGWRFSKYIDVGNGGVGDRHIDLFWGAWTLNFNLGTDEYREVFFNAYGRELIDDRLLRAVLAAECFG
jgi:kanamycin kinase